MTHQDEKATSPEDVKDSIEWQTVTLRVIAVLMILGAAWAGAAILVPFVLAVTMTIAISPAADWLEHKGFNRTFSSLACTLTVAAALTAATAMIVYQAGTIVQDSDKYLKGFGSKIDDIIARTRMKHAARSLGIGSKEKDGETPSESKRPEDAGGRAPVRQELATSTKPVDSGEMTADPENKADGATTGDGGTNRASTRTAGGDGEKILKRSLNAAGGWLLAGAGGLIGSVGQGVLFVAYLFYMLEGRGSWVETLRASGRTLGLRPETRTLETVQNQVVMYVGCLSMIATGYAVVVSLLLWWIGVPQPILWGILAGMLEVVPYFGPLVASVCPTIVAFSLGSWWQPLAVIGVFLTLHLVEGYLIEPKLYGRAVRLDPVTILFGAIFFGALWGPGGLALATPMLIVLRGLIMISPETPALDTLAGVGHEKAVATSTSRR